VFALIQLANIFCLAFIHAGQLSFIVGKNTNMQRQYFLADFFFSS
jgi:hypothetical protein